MEYKNVLKSALSACKTEEEREAVRLEYLSLVKLSGTSVKEAIEFMRNVEDEMNERERGKRNTEDGEARS